MRIAAITSASAAISRSPVAIAALTSNTSAATSIAAMGLWSFSKTRRQVGVGRGFGTAFGPWRTRRAAASAVESPGGLIGSAIARLREG